MKQAINSKTTLFNRLGMAILVTAGAGLSLSAQAATVTGNIGVTIELGSGCQINGHAGQTQPLDFGDIDFGQWMSLSTNSPNIDANTSGSAGGGVVIECNTNITYNIEIDEGQNPDGGAMRMENTTIAGQYVVYQLFTDATYGTAWVPNTPIPYASSGTSGTPVAVTHHFYGRVAPQAQTNPGIYQDTVQVTVTW